MNEYSISPPYSTQRKKVKMNKSIKQASLFAVIFMAFYAYYLISEDFKGLLISLLVFFIILYMDSKTTKVEKRLDKYKDAYGAIVETITETVTEEAREEAMLCSSDKENIDRENHINENNKRTINLAIRMLAESSANIQGEEM